MRSNHVQIDIVMANPTRTPEVYHWHTRASSSERNLGRPELYVMGWDARRGTWERWTGCKVIDLSVSFLVVSAIKSRRVIVIM